MDWQYDGDPVPYRLLICAMIAIRSNRRAAIACLLALTFAGALASHTSAVSSAEVLLQGEASQKNARRPALDEDRRLRDDRAAMVRTQIASRGIRNDAVLATMARVPRHEFVPTEELRWAYEDGPLPIGHGQTISQPYIVAYMTEILRVEPNDRVLEVGTGSGYQAAILAELAKEIVSIEIIKPLAQSAAKRLERLGYRNITVLDGDGYFGWESAAPYDAIVVTAAATHVPPPLVAQLKPGGRMAIPVGDTAWTQNLLLIEKDKEGKLTTRNLIPVRFVPLTRER
ncbi:MAG TPA: protein-L-isoaspartate(D-aspartate) O-methyltransferase [Casimicrobiaceae bacterium]|jgi:protein-L-isoaspartate(D-aspartate) O-methyltransferase